MFDNHQTQNDLISFMTKKVYINIMDMDNMYAFDSIQFEHESLYLLSHTSGWHIFILFCISLTHNLS